MTVREAFESEYNKVLDFVDANPDIYDRPTVSLLKAHMFSVFMAGMLYQAKDSVNKVHDLTSITDRDILSTLD